jgi:hypothetical protein
VIRTGHDVSSHAGSLEGVGAGIGEIVRRHLLQTLVVGKGLRGALDAP